MYCKASPRKWRANDINCQQTSSSLKRKFIHFTTSISYSLALSPGNFIFTTLNMSTFNNENVYTQDGKREAWTVFAEKKLCSNCHLLVLSSKTLENLTFVVNRKFATGFAFIFFQSPIENAFNASRHFNVQTNRQTTKCHICCFALNPIVSLFI